MRLANKNAIITGGASGIGAAVVRRFVQEGADVTIADISDTGNTVAEAVRKAGGKASFVRADMRDFGAIRALFDAHMERCGRLDILLNNASWEGSGKSIADTTEEELDAVLTTNFKSVFLACKLAGPIMTAAGGGSIINVSAGSARECLAWPNLGAYIGSRGHDSPKLSMCRSPAAWAVFLEDLTHSIPTRPLLGTTTRQRCLRIA